MTDNCIVSREISSIDLISSSLSKEGVLARNDPLPINWTINNFKCYLLAGRHSDEKANSTEIENVYAVKQAEVGVPVREVARKYGVSENMIITWRKKYGGLSVSELARLKQLEQENTKLKQMAAELSLDKAMLQEVLRKRLKPAVR